MKSVMISIKPQYCDLIASGKMIYYWHISDLVIYDEPKPLMDFKPYYRRECYWSDLGLAIPKCDECHDCGLKRPPQSWCYVDI